MASPNKIYSEYAVDILKTMENDFQLREIKLVAELDEEGFWVHRLIMMSSSEYFRALLGPNFKEGQEEDVTIYNIYGSTLKAIIDFCYSGCIKITNENVMEIIEAASAMEFVRIEKKCEHFWSENLALSNCLDTFLSADKYSLKDLREKSLNFICEQFEALPVTELQKINANFIADLLKCDKIHAREEFIFRRLAEWAGYHETTRAKYVPDLLKLIQLDKISQPFLADVVENLAKKYECMDVVSNEYRRRAESDDKSTGLYRYTADALLSKCIFALSCEADVINVEKYNPISNRWELFRNITITGLITARDSFGLVYDKDLIVLIGGRILQGSVVTDYMCKVDTYLFDKMQFLTRDNITTKRSCITPILYNEQIFIFGGWAGSVLKTCECVSLETMTSAAIEPMQYGRYNYACAIMDEKIYVAGGLVGADADSHSCEVECYEPINGKWTKIANMNHPRANFGLAVLDGMLYAMGDHKSIERYDPIRCVWSEIGAFDGSETVVQAINSQNEIYALMSDGRFGKFKTEPVCSFMPLRNFPDRKIGRRNLFIN